MFHWPGNDRVITKAYKQATTGEVDNALTLLRRAARSSDPKGNRAEAMGMILYQRGLWAEATEALAHALKMQPESMTRLFYCADATARAGEWDNAMSMLDEAARKCPTDVAPLSAKCLILIGRCDGAAALTIYGQARKIFSENPAQDAYSMGLLQQCADSLAEFEREHTEH